jgi:hypothetical protein
VARRLAVVGSQARSQGTTPDSASGKEVELEEKASCRRRIVRTPRSEGSHLSNSLRVFTTKGASHCSQGNGTLILTAFYKCDHA